MRQKWLILTIFVCFFCCFSHAQKKGKTRDSGSKPGSAESIPLAKEFLFSQTELAINVGVFRFQNTFLQKVFGRETTEEQKQDLEEKVFLPFQEQLQKAPLPVVLSKSIAQKNFVWFLSFVLVQEGAVRLKEKWKQEFFALPFDQKSIKSWIEKTGNKKYIQEELENEVWQGIHVLSLERIPTFYQTFSRLEEIENQESQEKEK